MKKSLFILFAACVLAACQPGDEERAAEYITRGEQQIAAGEWNSALTTLDSVDALFPKLIDARRSAKHLKDSIAYMQAVRSLEYVDAQLTVAEQRLDSLLDIFVFEKDEKYQSTGNLFAKRLLSNGNDERSFLQAFVNEKGVPFVRSVYYGSKSLNHSDVSVSVGDEATTSVTAIKSSHAFENHEFLTFEGDNALTLLTFVANHTQDKIKVTLKGDGESSYVINSADAQALAQTYELALAFADVNTLRHNADMAQHTIGKWENRQ